MRRDPGPLAGTLLTVAVLLAWLAAQLFAAAALLAVRGALSTASVDELAAQLEADATALCLVSALAGGVAFAFVLALHRPRWRAPPWQLALGAALTLGFHLAAGALGRALERPDAPESVLRLYEGAHPLAFALAILVAAPLWEEALFRGLFFDAWSRTRLGPGLAVLVSAAAWSAIHVEYDLYDVTTLFLYGLLLGALRWRTGSLGLAVLLHALFNTIALVELMLITA